MTNPEGAAPAPSPEGPDEALRKPSDETLARIVGGWTGWSPDEIEAEDDRSEALRAARAVYADAVLPLLTAEREPCVMTHQPPFDFAQCETHDETFPLGGKCRFDGRDPVEVYAEAADEQRQRAVLAEMARDEARERADRLAQAVEEGIASLATYARVAETEAHVGPLAVLADLRAALSATDTGEQKPQV